MTVNQIRQNLKQHFLDNKMAYECFLIDIISDAEVMTLRRKIRRRV